MNDTPYDAVALKTALAAESIGQTVEIHDSVPSTMPLARRLAEERTIPPGAVVIAEEQTAGRGRLARHWEAPYGQALLLTVVLRAELLPSDPTHIPMVAGLAILDAIAQVAPQIDGRLGLKWPNDVLIAGRKVAGILVESSYTGEQLSYALLGMGINVNQDSAALPPPPAGGIAPTSIAIEGAQAVDRTQLAIALCRSLAHWLSLIAEDNGERLFATWQQRLTTLGMQVSVRSVEGGPAVQGQAVSVDRQGRLIVVDSRGERHAFGAGDVTLSVHSADSTDA